MRATLSALTGTPAVMRQRAILTVAGRQFVFDGHVTRRRDGTMRLVALNPVGVAAEIEAVPGGEPHVLRTGPGLRTEWVRAYMARDLVSIFGRVGGEGLRAVRTVDGRPALERPCEKDGAETVRYIFRAGGERLEAIVKERGGRRPYLVTCGEHRESVSPRIAVPMFYRVRARRYQVDLRVVTFQESGS